MANPGDSFDGPVGYRHPWHYAVDEEGHLMLDMRLVTDGDGSYKVAGAEDTPHFDRFHEKFAEVNPVP